MQYGSRSESISDHKKHQCFAVMWNAGALFLVVKTVIGSCNENKTIERRGHQK